MARAFPAAPAWAEVSLGALAHNLERMKRLAAPAGVIAMVKANAYGHGLVEASRAFLKAGAWGLAVAFPAEGTALRRAGVRAPILVVAPVLKEGALEALRSKLIPQVSSYEGALLVSRAAEKLRLSSVPVQVELDTGMGRVGFRPGEIFRDLGRLLKLPRLRFTAFYAHFATADWADPKFAARQARTFHQVMRGAGFFLSPREKAMPTHLANSAALLTRALRSPAALARPGIALYGVPPSPRLDAGLKPAMSLRARILHLKTIDKGDAVSYGRTFVAKRPTRVATLGLGYADGLHRALS
ncbi:MAG TPA: alanine racemase, partial [bacterium]|nr:alanine racemase [bacterium]